jgi:hypothetical protein
MNRDAWHNLIITFAPQVTLSYTGGDGNYNDKYLPSSIDWFLERCSLVDEPKKVDVEGPSRSTIATTQSETARLNPNSKDVNKGDYSQITKGTWPMYVHVLKSEYPSTEAETDHIDLQYWFYYPYSGGIGGLFVPFAEFHGAHEGDWEFISVRVRNWHNNPNLTASNIVGVFYAAHRSEDGK